MSKNDPIVICSAMRTPIGDFQGELSSLTATHLGARAIEAALRQSGIPATSIDEVIMGCVLSAGLGQAPARQAALGAQLPQSTPSTTINKMCGSGLKSIMMSCDALLANRAEVVVAGGLESMSNAPYLLDKARAGYRMGHGKILDHMFLDGLEDAYDKGKLMGVFAEQTASHYGLTRKIQDDFSLQSLSRAKIAIERGYFEAEITPIDVPSRKETLTVLHDSLPGKAQPDKIPKLKPAFDPHGTVTAANSSAISDGAAALTLTKLSNAQANSWPIIGVVRDYCTFAQAPEWFTTAPVGAIKRLLEANQLKANDVDLYEINEAFAVVTLAAMKELALSTEKVNVHGGACALGHPIGASGARIATTLLHAMKQYNLKTGIASLCIGGGEAVAVLFERTDACL